MSAVLAEDSETDPSDICQEASARWTARILHEVPPTRWQRRLAESSTFGVVLTSLPNSYFGRTQLNDVADIVSLQGLLAVVLWVALLVYGFSSVWWIVEVALLSHGWKRDTEEVWGLDDIQVRILTIDTEPVVQQTVNAIPDGIADIRVIAEADINIQGAQVHVVPENFECKATNKGRAVEWARRNVDADEEYLLYLD